MSLAKEFKVPISAATVRNRVQTYFEQARYQPADSEDPPRKYIRGSRLGSWFPLNPSKIKCVATVNIEQQGNQVNVKINFDTGKNIKDDTHFTQEFWENELKEFETALFKGEYLPLASKKLTQRTFLRNLLYLFSGIVWILIWAVVSLILIFPSVRFFNSFDLSPDLLAIIIMIIAFFVTRGFSKYWKNRGINRNN